MVVIFLINKKFKDRFQFDLGVIYKSINVLGDEVYCFGFADYKHPSPYTLLMIFQKLGYHYNHKHGFLCYSSRLYRGISINQNSKEFWFYTTEFESEKIVNNKGDWTLRDHLENRILKEQPELLNNDVYFFLKDRSSNILPEYIRNYKPSVFERIREWLVEFLESCQ